MKIILTISLLLSGMISMGQSAKISKWYYFNPQGDTTTTFEYVYEDSSLEYIYERYDGDSSNIKATYTYENGYCMQKDYIDAAYTYMYIEDTVLETLYNNSGDSIDYRYYTLNEENCIIDDDIYDFYWDNGNVIEMYHFGNTIWTREYDTYYLNPWFEQNKYLRGAGITGFLCGSYNQMTLQSRPSGSYAVFVVTEAIGPYPTKIESWLNGLLSSSYHIYYDTVITDIPKIPSESYTVFSIDYYDLIGRKILKPTKGFYIERKTTDKGIISKKYYIQ